MKPLAVVVIATGDETYKNFACDLMNALRHWFPPHEVILFSEQPLPKARGAIHIPHPPLEWVRTTITRYHWMLQEEARLSQYENILFMDADMLPVSRITADDLQTAGILAVQHPLYPQAWERNPASTAYVEGDHEPYFQGCLQGGATVPFLEMCRVLAHNTDVDDAHDVVAICHDESHMNRFLFDHPPTKILGPEFAFPGPLNGRDDVLYPRLIGLEPRIRHRDKGMRRVGR